MTRSIIFLLSTASAAFDVAVGVGSAHASTSITSLTSVTIDVCVAKQRFPFGDKNLLGLTSHLGGGNSILRIGGSDQNSFFYDMASNKNETFSAKTGGSCCQHTGSCRGCANDCTMPAPYWKSISDFAAASGHQLMFGLIPDVEEATSLISHSAKAELPVFAYSFGNEKDSASVTDGYSVLRKLLDSIFSAGKVPKPKLAGPDAYAQRNYEYTLDEALAGEDKTITEHLSFMRDFAEKAGPTLDAFSWHTYDYETPMLGMKDHLDLRVNPLMARLWSTRHLDFALRLQGNVTDIARRAAPGAEVWISESNSVCHQGINGVTNAYLNSVWLVNRLGTMANANLSVMARQSLVGYNYSLLGNWPVEPIKPNPDYFTTVLFQRLFGDTVLATTTTPSAPGPPPTNITEGGDRARAFAFCASESVKRTHGASASHAGAVSIALINFDPTEPATFTFDPALGSHADYVLSPGADPLVASAAWSSRQMLLNGVALEMSGPDWKLPAAVTGGGAQNKGGIVLPPLHVGFAVFLTAGAPDCS
jgi:hypothetical protein